MRKKKYRERFKMMEESSTVADAGWVEERGGINLKNHGL